MRKAYVKPVFLAEEFAAETSYAASVCGVSKYTPFELEIGQKLCPNGDEGHYVGGQNGDSAVVIDDWYYDNQYSNWQYATHEDGKATIFMDTACDFWWDPNTGREGKIYVWNSLEQTSRTEKYTGDKKWGFFQFLSGSNANHVIAFNGTEYPQS